MPPSGPWKKGPAWKKLTFGCDNLHMIMHSVAAVWFLILARSMSSTQLTLSTSDTSLWLVGAPCRAAERRGEQSTRTCVYSEGRRCPAELRGVIEHLDGVLNPGLNTILGKARKNGTDTGTKFWWHH